MNQGFIKVAAGTPQVTVADCKANTSAILKVIREMETQHAKLMVLPELCITGYTCQDLFLQRRLLDSAWESLLTIAEETADVDALIFVGLPMRMNGKLYNVAAALNHGNILGFVPKTHIPNYNEFYEQRHFASGADVWTDVTVGEESVPFASNLIFSCEGLPELTVGAEICEDLWVPLPPSVNLAQGGAHIIVNLSASDEMVGKDSYRRDLVKGQSARLVCGYIYATAGEGESSQDLVFGGQNLIAENGTMLAEAKRFQNTVIYGEIDVQRLADERRRLSTYPASDDADCQIVPFEVEVEETSLTRKFAPYPFVPSVKEERDMRCEEILNIQAMGLKKRMSHIHCQKAMEVNIKEAVNIHFRDIGHDDSVHDVTYENCQARERTQILMDMANQEGALLVGTGDLSELALGWATYNGDHMSMYGVNASVPKTLVRHLVRYYADTCGEKELEEVLLDILDTPVSPELLPPKDGKIAQKTEDLVGPYELHDFYLYYMLRAGFEPDKIYRIACRTFEGTYDKATILKWLKIFYRRFFAQQFKRSCLPDGPKVGSVALSPRGDLRMPSDASAAVWMEALEKLEV